MGLRSPRGVCALALIAGSAALQFEPAVICATSSSTTAASASPSAPSGLPLWSAAFAQSADSFSLDNVSFTFGPTTYEAKRIELSGVTSPRAEIEALFSSTSTEPMESRLTRINAKQITIPEARVEADRSARRPRRPPIETRSLSDIAQGRIASALIEATARGSRMAPRTMSLVSTGRTTMNGLDLPATRTALRDEGRQRTQPHGPDLRRLRRR